MRLFEITTPSEPDEFEKEEVSPYEHMHTRHLQYTHSLHTKLRTDPPTWRQGSTSKLQVDRSVAHHLHPWIATMHLGKRSESVQQALDWMTTNFKKMVALTEDDLRHLSENDYLQVCAWIKVCQRQLSRSLSNLIADNRSNFVGVDLIFQPNSGILSPDKETYHCNGYIWDLLGITENVDTGYYLRRMEYTSDSDPSIDDVNQFKELITMMKQLDRLENRR